MPTIPLCDLQQQYQSLKGEIDHAMQQVAADAHYILGPNVRALEQEIANYHGSRYAIGVGSGTDALTLSLRALNIGAGDEVITTPFTFIGTTEAICMAGAKPVFVDVDSSTCNIDVRQIEAAITPRTKAVLPVHLYGQPCEMDRLVEFAGRYQLSIVEDCAQAIGATHRGQKVGTFGKAGCFSFFPSKNLGCFGDGGMVVTDDPEVYERVEMLRRHGGKVKYHHTEIGLNSRLDELQAAVLRVKLKYLEGWNSRRRAVAHYYQQLLADLSDIELPTTELSGSRSVFHQFTIQVDRRDEIARRLNEQEVQTCVYYPVPLHLQEVHGELGYRRGDFPVAERLASRCLSLPIFPEITESQQRAVANSLHEALSIAHHQAA